MQIPIEHEALSLVYYVEIHVDILSIIVSWAIKPSPSSVK